MTHSSNLQNVKQVKAEAFKSYLTRATHIQQKLVEQQQLQ